MKLTENYFDHIKALKSTLLISRYQSAALVNRAFLASALVAGKFISNKFEVEKWHKKPTENLLKVDVKTLKKLLD